jgi:hypothetical protein
MSKHKPELDQVLVEELIKEIPGLRGGDLSGVILRVTQLVE